MGHNSLSIRTTPAERPCGRRGDEVGSSPRSRFNRGAALGGHGLGGGSIGRLILAAMISQEFKKAGRGSFSGANACYSTKSEPLVRPRLGS